MVSQCISGVCLGVGCYSRNENPDAQFLPDEFHLASTCSFEETKTRWGKVVFRLHDVQFAYIRDTITHDIYNDDTLGIMRFKCACLIPATAVFVVARSIYNAVEAIFRGFRLDGFQQSCRSIYYGTLALASACYGIVNPYEGRRLYNYCERVYHHNEVLVDRRSHFYLAPCFVPLNYNLPDKADQEMSIQALKNFVLRHKYVR